VKRGALVFAVVSLLLFADGSYLQVTKNEVGGDSGVLFGNPHFFLSAGTVVLISGGFLLLGAAIMWAVAVRRERRVPAGRGQVRQAAAGAPPAQVSAGQGEGRKESGDQR